MDRIMHDLIPGSEQWHEFRFVHHGASEAAAMLGVSTKTKRTELLHMKHTGSKKEFTDWVQKNILDYGHHVEAQARPLVESIIGEELYPSTHSFGKLSASTDGLTMSGRVAFEHKQWAKELAGSVMAGILPPDHAPQCQQILYVTGADALIFVVSDGTPGNLVHMMVYPDPEYAARLVAGWDQFDRDLSDFVPMNIVEKPKAADIQRLPTLAIQIKGEVSLSNLPAFKQAADAFIAGIKTDLETDQDFSDAEAIVKLLGDTEKELELAKKLALAQTVDINELMQTVDKIQLAMKTKRLALNQMVTRKKEAIKIDAIHAAQLVLEDYVRALNDELRPVMIRVAADLMTAAKNKRTLASLHDAIDTEVARCKIAADAQALIVRTNLTVLRARGSEYAALFADIQTIALLDCSAFSAIVENRVTGENLRNAQRELTATQAAKQALSKAAVENTPTPVDQPAITAQAIAPTPKYSAKPGPTLHQIASSIAFEHHVDVKTAMAWIITAVNTEALKEAA